jgi:hypothetical protein
VSLSLSRPQNRLLTPIPSFPFLPTFSQTNPRASSSSSAPAPTPAASSSSSSSAPRATLRVHETAETVAARLGLPPSLVALDKSANLDITARKRGPQPFDIRAGARPREELDLTAHLVEQAAPARVSDASTQIDVMQATAQPHPPAYSRPLPKRGMDTSTQVEAGTTEWVPRAYAGEGTDVLFRFDDVVAPTVAGLADALLAQSLDEVEHEDELVALARRRETVQAALDRDAAVAKQLEAKAKAAAASKHSTVQAAQQVHDRAVRAMEKVAAQATARSLLASEAVPSAFADLREGGAFYDPTVAAMERDVLPGILDGVAARLAREHEAGAVVDGLLAGALEAGAAAYAKEQEAEAARQAELKRKYYIRVYVRIPRRPEDIAAFGILPPGTKVPVDEGAQGAQAAVEGGEEGGAGAASAAAPAAPVEVFDSDDGATRTIVVGPIPVTKLDNVMALEQRIHTWVLAHPNRHTRHVLAMGGGAASPLALFLAGARMLADDVLLMRPLEELGSLELRPRGPEGWLLDVPEVGEAAAAAAAAVPA